MDDGRSYIRARKRTGIPYSAITGINPKKLQYAVYNLIWAVWCL